MNPLRVTLLLFVILCFQTTSAYSKMSVEEATKRCESKSNCPKGHKCEFIFGKCRICSTVISHCDYKDFKLSGIDSTPNNGLKHGDKFQDCPECPKMIVVRGGTFVMGSEEREKGRGKAEGPRHEVRIKTFAVGQYEVTRGQFHSFVLKTGYKAGYKCWTFENSNWKERSNRNYLKPGFSQNNDHPVTCVNWNDAKAYVKWLSRKTGESYRLLTEAEWEYVASAKHSTAFWWGNSISTDQANYNGNKTYNGSKGVYREKTVPVNKFKENPFGLYNVHGNVWEWVEDCWHDSYKGAPTDGSAWLVANGENCKHRVLRGGAWSSIPQGLRTRSRGRVSRVGRCDFAGFRVARTP